ncbi:MAG: YjbH domain-containing protein [Synergistaceae bacterium]|nr:YjbH domain-containing protein [Synergistaceae bacterium]MBQ9629120.1 YjbH domain-containing protein [Synergistaceae bacterium]
MRRVLTGSIFILMCIMFFTVSFSLKAEASTGNNTGLTGLWEYPTAEMPEDGTGRFGYTNASPYAYYFLDLAWLPWLEINARFNTFSTVTADGKPDGRDYMDKAIDLKAILWHNKDPEKWYVPSIAFGIVDATGTEIMRAWYGAATWRWGNVAATIGYGTDRFNGVYAGLEWDIANWITLKAEYSPLDYDKDRVAGRRVLDELPSGKYNLGLVLKAPWGMEGSASWQRGDEFVFSISQKIDLKGPFLGGSKKHYGTPGDSRIPEWANTNKQEILARIKSGIEKYVRVRDIDIKLEEYEDSTRLILGYENYGYSSHAEAMTRIIVLLSAVMPETDELVLIHKNAGIPVVSASFPGKLLFAVRARSLHEEEPMRTAIFSWAGSDSESGFEDADEKHFLENKATHEVKAMIVYEPRLDQTLSEFYMDRWNIDLIYNGRYYNGWGSVIDIRFPFHVNADTTNVTGLWWEKDLNDKIRIQQLGMTYANKFDSKGRAWFFGEGGYLDEEWFGGNLWARYYGENGDWWIGARLAAYRDRDPESFGGFTDGRYMYYGGNPRGIDNGRDWWNTMFVQAGYHFEDFDVDLEAEYGSFVDDDKGYKISLTRHWDDTALGFWYIDTDIDAPGKSFTKAGVHMEIPAEKWFGSWFGNSSSHVWEQDTMILSSWRMHSGREGGHIRTPERMMSQLRPAAMKKNVERLLMDYCSYEEGEVRAKEESQQVKSLLEYIFH